MTDKQQRLWFAALDGDLIKVQQLIEEGANVNASTDLFRATALHRAVLLGRSDAVTTLLKAGADIHKEDTDGFTALHMATRSGDRMSLKNLIKAGAVIESRNKDGRTPLHIAALNGDYKTAQLLINSGANTRVLDKKLKTPADLARDQILLKKSEGSLELTEGLHKTIHVIEDDEQCQSRSLYQVDETEADMAVIPDPIKNMGPEAERRFLNYLAEGSERHYEINVMFVGHSGAGKTTLTYGLLGELDPNVTPDKTNGIDVHLHRCRYNRKTRQMYGIAKGMSDDDHIYARVGNIYQEMTEIHTCPESKETKEEEIQTDTNDLMSPTKKQRTDEWDTAEYIPGISKEINPEPDVWKPKRLLRKARLRSNKDNLVPITLWDFGGQSVFYTTHQTFLSSRCIYVLTFDVSGLQQMNISDGSQGEVKGKEFILENIGFWTNSIITYAKDKVSGFPKIILVGTHVDKIPIEDKDLEVWRIFQALEDYFRGKDSRQHVIIDPRYFVNARDTEGVPFELIREALIQIAESLPHWGERMPTKWLPLEEYIANQKAKGVKIMTIEDIQKCQNMNEQCEMDSQELYIFLQFCHSLGKILYFNEPSLRHRVILDPKWLIDALCTLITSEHFAEKIVPAHYRDYWSEMETVGKLNTVLIKEIWRKPMYKEFSDNMNILLQMMDRLDLITKPIHSARNTTADCDFYYVPSMVKLCAPENVRKEIIFCSDSEITFISFTFRNTFLPPAVFYRVVASMLCMFDVLEACEDDRLASMLPNKLPLLFSDLCAFRVSKYQRLVVQKSEHRILIHMYRIDNRGKSAIDNKSLQNIQGLISDTLKTIVKVYSAFQNLPTDDDTLPFYLEIPGCKLNPPCMIDKKLFLKLCDSKCPKHSKTLISVSILGDVFGTQTDDVVCDTGRQQKYINTRHREEINDNTELILDYVAAKVSETALLAAALNVKYEFVNKLRHIHDSHEKTYSVLYHWYNKSSKVNLLQELCSALFVIDRKDICEKLPNFCRSKYLKSQKLPSIPDPEDKVLQNDIAWIAKRTVHYKRLSRFLGIPNSIIQQAEHTNIDMSEKAIYVLTKWERHDQTYNRVTLCAGLVYLKEIRLVNELICRWNSKK